MIFLKYLKQNLEEITKLPTIIDPANIWKLQEIRIQPKQFKLSKQYNEQPIDENTEEKQKGKVSIYYIAQLPVDIVLNIRGANNEDSLLLSAIKYSAIIQHFLKTTKKLPYTEESLEDFNIKSNAIIKPINIEGNLEPVLFTDNEDIEDAKKFAGFQDRFSIELIFRVHQIIDVPVVKNIQFEGFR